MGAEEFGSDPTGDVYRGDPIGGYTSSPDVWLTWATSEPGMWTLVEGAPAPVPTPASLPLALLGAGTLGLLAYHRRAAA